MGHLVPPSSSGLTEDDGGTCARDGRQWFSCMAARVPFWSAGPLAQAQRHRDVTVRGQVHFEH